jgi:hypothetical protein
MIGETWKIRSLAKQGQKQAIIDFMSEHKIEFIGLHETKKEIIDPDFLKSISGVLSSIGLVCLPKNCWRYFGRV